MGRRMNLTPGRSKRLESAISILLLVVLVLVGIGVFVRQFYGDIGRFGIEAAALQGLAGEATTGSDERTVLAGAVPSGFEEYSELKVYEADNLYEKINGKAPLYTDSGFEKLFCVRFANEADQALKMEIYLYDMGAAKNAFSVYSTQKRPDGEFPAQWNGLLYKTANGVYLVHGKYYIEVVGFAKSQDLVGAMAAVAESLKAGLQVGDDLWDSEPILFGKQGLVAGSSKLYLASVFSFEGLTDTFTARYKADGETVTVFLSERADPQEARKMAESYRNFLIENGAKEKTAAEKALAQTVLDFYGGTEIVFAKGRFVAGVHDAENHQAAEKLALRILADLNQRTKGAEQ